MGNRPTASTVKSFFRAPAKSWPVTEWRGRDAGVVRYLMNGVELSRRLYSNDRTMQRETSFDAWVCMAAGGENARASVDVEYGLNPNHERVHERFEDSMRSICDKSRLKRAFVGSLDGDVLFCSDWPARGPVHDLLVDDANEIRPGFSRGKDFAVTMQFAAKTRDKSVTAYCGYRTVGAAEAHALFLAEVIEGRWPGGRDHVLTVVLDPSVAHKRRELASRLAEVSPYQTEVVIRGEDRYSREAGDDFEIGFAPGPGVGDRSRSSFEASAARPAEDSYRERMRRIAAYTCGVRENEGGDGYEPGLGDIGFDVDLGW